MFTDKDFIVQCSISSQVGVRKASEEQIAAAEYIPADKKDSLWLTMDGYPNMSLPGQLSFSREAMSISQYKTNLLYGHSVTALHGRQDPYRWVGSFSGQWEGAQTILLDADECPIELQDLWDRLQRKPTFAFTTQHHQVANYGNRFRLVYAFDQVMHNKDDYNKIAHALMFEVEETIRQSGYNDYKLDPCTTGEGRFFLGNPNAGVTTFDSWTVYSPLDIVSVYDDTPHQQFTTLDVDTKSSIQSKQAKHSQSDKGKGVSPTRPHPFVYLKKDIAQNMKRDCEKPNADIQEIVMKYSKHYITRFKTSLEETPAEQSYIECPDDYLEIWFRWLTHYQPGRKPIKEIKRFRNGDGRHLLLRIQLLVVMAIHHDRLCFDELVFHALALFNMAYSNKNRDGSICTGKDYFTPVRLWSIAKEVWIANPEYVKITMTKQFKKCHKSWMVNPKYADAQGKRPIEVKGEVQHDITVKKWFGHIEKIKTMVKNGITYSKIAETLSAMLGKPIKSSTLGRYIRLWRKKNSEVVKTGDVNAEKNDKICADCVFSPYFTHFSSTSSTLSTSPHPPYTPNKRQAILSDSNQMNQANTTRFQMVDERYAWFCSLFDPTLSRNQNLKIMKDEGFVISASTFKRYKRRWEKEKTVRLDSACTYELVV